MEKIIGIGVDEVSRERVENGKLSRALHGEKYPWTSERQGKRRPLLRRSLRANG